MKLYRLIATLLALTAAFNAQAADKVKIGMLTTQHQAELQAVECVFKHGGQVQARLPKMLDI